MLPNGRGCAEYLAYLIHGYQRAFLSLWSKIGSTVDSIEVPDMRNTSMPVPSIDEQKAIISYLDRETAQIDGLIERVRESIARLREYRTALISAAVTGKIDVRGDCNE
jgi:restriction endonuclease S subunit